MDSQKDKIRQKQLYGNDLKFDENRPIYQHPINLAHFTDEKYEEVFETMVNNIEDLYPDPETKQLLKQYKQIQLQIDKTNEGYLYELQNN